MPEPNPMPQTLGDEARAERNRNPLPEAVFATFYWPRQYANQNGGPMDFLASLKPSDQAFCCRVVDAVLQAAQRMRQAHVKTKRS